MHRVKKGILLGLCAGLLIRPMNIEAAKLTAGYEAGLTTSDIKTEEQSDVFDVRAAILEAKNEILVYQQIVSQNCYDKKELQYIVDGAIELLEDEQNIGKWTKATLSELVAKTKGRMDELDYANAPQKEKEPELPAPTDYVQVGGNWVTPTASYGNRVSVVLPIVNMGKETVTDVIVSPVLDIDPENWPFDIEQSSYTVKLDALAGENVNGNAMERRQEITWNFRTRKDVTSGFKKIGFQVQYTNAAGEQVNTTLYTYVKAVGALGTGKGDSTSTPRLIVTGFETDPETVQAGDAFSLTLHMKNTSKRTAVSNVEFTLKAAEEGEQGNSYEAFLPVAGSNTLYVETIPANGTTDLTIDLKSRADLAQKPYVLNINMKYEDDDLNPFAAESSVSIPIRQEARFETSEPEVMPSSIDVGSESNIMFSIYNTGKTTLYNVSVHFEGDTISGGDCFIGNIQPGGTGQVDAMVFGESVTMDEGIIHAVITYEDNETNKTEVKKEISLFVMEPVYEEYYEPDIYEEEKQINWIIPVIIVVVAAGAVTGVVLYRKRKKRASEILEDGKED